MDLRRGLVVDANLLTSAGLGRRVREQLARYDNSATSYSPDRYFDGAPHYLSQVLKERGLGVEAGIAISRTVSRLAVLVDRQSYSQTTF